jgi:hypothetical protein
MMSPDKETGRLRYLPTIARRVNSLRAIALLVAIALGGAAAGQEPPVHSLYRGDLPPGAVGRAQLVRDASLRNYFQPVELHVPEGGSVSLAVDGRFTEAKPGPVMAGMLIGQVYRVKIAGIPRNEGLEVFPSVEVINRLCTPPGLERHFPIPVHFTLEELELALAGNYVTRVIYLEHPDDALPVQDVPGRQRYFEVRSDEDPLAVADRLGRPVAILRMGSRIPQFDQVSQRFLFDCPPLTRLQRPQPPQVDRTGLEDPLGFPEAAAGGVVPRTPPSAADRYPGRNHPLPEPAHPAIPPGHGG